MSDSAVLPALRADVSLETLDTEVAIVFDDAVFSVSGAAPPLIHDAMAQMNGILGVEEIGERVGLPASVIFDIVATLGSHGLISTEPPPPTVTVEGFVGQCRDLFPIWKRRLFGHPLWVGLSSGELPRETFVGWAIETWWFIENVMDRLPTAVFHTENRAARHILMRHFSEEWDHFQFFDESLESLGVDRDMRRRLTPLPATRAVRDWMRMSARRDVLRYIVCSGFLESTGRDRDNARSFFERVREHYDGEGGKAVQPMAAHVALDEDYGHGSLVEQLLEVLGRPDGSISGSRALEALRDAYGFVETLELWSSDILRHYRSPESISSGAIRAYRPRQS